MDLCLVGAGLRASSLVHAVEEATWLATGTDVSHALLKHYLSRREDVPLAVSTLLSCSLFQWGFLLHDYISLHSHNISNEEALYMSRGSFAFFFY